MYQNRFSNLTYKRKTTHNGYFVSETHTDRSPEMASNGTSNSTDPHDQIVIPLWIFGISLSSLCFILQALILIFIPKTRNLDQKIIIQLTLVRVIYSITEYEIIYVEPMSSALVFILFSVYQQCEVVFLCWTFVFTKNLYNKIVIAFKTDKFHYALYTFLIWISGYLIGMMCPILLNYSYYHYKIFYLVFAFAKLCVICYNVWLFYGIYSVLIKCRTTKHENNVKDVLKICINTFIIVSISFLHVFIFDSLTFFCGRNIIVSYISGILNSFQTTAFTIIFMILVHSARSH